MVRQENDLADPRQDAAVLVAEQDREAAEARLADALVALRAARAAVRILDTRLVRARAEGDTDKSGPEQITALVQAQAERQVAQARADALLEEAAAAATAHKLTQARYAEALEVARRAAFDGWYEAATALAEQVVATVSAAIAANEAARQHHQLGSVWFGSTDGKVKNPTTGDLVDAATYVGLLRPGAFEEYLKRLARTGPVDQQARRRREVERLAAEARELEAESERRLALEAEAERLRETVIPLVPTPSGSFGLPVKWFRRPLESSAKPKPPGAA